MNQRAKDMKRALNSSHASGAHRQAKRIRGARRDVAKTAADPRYAFDANAWLALITEQKLNIAHAAGVDPSKVRIRIGH